ncbi:MAG TPA: phosphate signaling complex protein PhoU [Thauera sp.]|jgi:phosphate transport system protein|nr:phosphate signaling complex protein PhoU [Thauera sp.]HRA81894.1 phosphate signaling complex protein PhoU [Thauera sp.]
MPESLHVSTQFDEDLARLRTHVLQMGGLVETQIAASIEAYASGEVDGVRVIVETDRRINDFEKAIDDDCAHVIARRQPIASDLRLILGISKIVTDLERTGDEAKKIAKGVRRIHDAGHLPNQYGSGIRHLAEAALSMVRQALDAFARMDGALALSVIRADVEVDVEFKSIIRQLITHMMEDPRTITASIDIIAISRAIERIGDHAKNISEQVVFVVEGRDIRYDKEAIR